MPWRIEAREDEWCVIKETDGSVAGCHASRERALAQQRALYAQEAETASAVGPVRVEIAGAPENHDVEEALVASVTAISDRLLQTQEAVGQIALVLKQLADEAKVDRASFQDTLAVLTAAAQQPAPEPPVVTVNVPETVVHVNVPEPIVNVTNENPAPVVNVTIPGSKKTITFERDPLTGQVSKADVVEKLE